MFIFRLYQGWLCRGCKFNIYLYNNYRRGSAVEVARIDVDWSYVNQAIGRVTTCVFVLSVDIINRNCANISFLARPASKTSAQIWGGCKTVRLRYLLCTVYHCSSSLQSNNVMLTSSDSKGFLLLICHFCISTAHSKFLCWHVCEMTNCVFGMLKIMTCIWLLLTFKWGPFLNAHVWVFMKITS